MRGEFLDKNRQEVVINFEHVLSVETFHRRFSPRNCVFGSSKDSFRIAVGQQSQLGAGIDAKQSHTWHEILSRNRLIDVGNQCAINCAG
ncbi:hypothetical protein Brsp06_04259 [Brucella sp. NBRC 13694]|nr:hypothetical protein DR92_2037 [Brucella anthropi]